MKIPRHSGYVAMPTSEIHVRLEQN
jgi:hypothetical protein